MRRTARVPVVAPFPWEQVLGYLAFRSTPGLESVDGGRYLRQTGQGSVAVTFEREAGVLLAEAEGLVPDDWQSRVARVFDAAHDPAPVQRVLRRCRVVRPIVDRSPGVRAPGCWEPFELCLRVVLGQQVSVKGAHTLMGRLAARCPGLDPRQVSGADLSGLGVTGRRIDTIRQLAQAVAVGRVRFDGRPWSEVSDALRALPGFGPWTLQYLAIRLGRDADAFPAEDLGLLRATGAETTRDLLKLAERWRPYRGYAAMHLWLGESSGPRKT